MVCHVHKDSPKCSPVFKFFSNSLLTVLCAQRPDKRQLTAGNIYFGIYSEDTDHHGGEGIATNTGTPSPGAAVKRQRGDASMALSSFVFSAMHGLWNGVAPSQGMSSPT